ncbi:MAG: alpha/beta fold hydrolase [Acidothermus sp.]|nr:alpha/beta fold hydrolase [Acidothermus sp.]MCL6537304.1 alpha/beta hydrolase [Acidothermus sp.]
MSEWPQLSFVPISRGLRLAVRKYPGSRRPFLLVHGLASNARLWDLVARHLAEAGHETVAVDLRGHGQSDAPPDGYDTETAASDLVRLCGALGLEGERLPIAVGQSWGGNVVLTLAARYRAVTGLVLVDGGWLCPRDRFPTFEECWSVLAPPEFTGVRVDDMRRHLRSAHPDWPAESHEAVLGNFHILPDGTVRPRLDRDHHRSILYSLWSGNPRELYPLVDVPVLLVAAVGAHLDPDTDHQLLGQEKPGILDACTMLRDVDVRWYVGADHDLHAQHPQRLAADLLEFAARIDRVPETG